MKRPTGEIDRNAVVVVVTGLDNSAGVVYTGPDDNGVVIYLGSAPFPSFRQENLMPKGPRRTFRRGRAATALQAVSSLRSLV